MSLTPRNRVTTGNTDAAQAAPQSRSKASRILLVLCAGLFFAGFVALGTWQVVRLQWKLALIERVDQRVHALASDAPGRERWPQISADSDEYRHVRLSGRFLYPRTAAVQASTTLGSGFWLLTPLQMANGETVLINRGFVKSAPQATQADAVSGAGETVAVTGLLRMTEPHGGFLRTNDPAAGRWFSRDVQAIAAAQGLSNAAPYFVDADKDGITVADAATAAKPAAEQGAEAPVGGLTVIAFHNNHLVYALTWYALALMVAGACYWVVRDDRRLQRGRTAANGTDRELKDGKQ
jgi:surfeit locus 1 family protein